MAKAIHDGGEPARLPPFFYIYPRISQMNTNSKLKTAIPSDARVSITGPFEDQSPPHNGALLLHGVKNSMPEKPCLRGDGNPDKNTGGMLRNF